jgi:hypothetical protein
MKKELEEKLFKRFSFFHPEASIQESLMAFGFEHDDGWFDIIWKLCEDLEKENKRMIDEMDPNDKTKILLQKGELSLFRVAQVKEKFGTLRFYTDLSSDGMDKLIREAEKKSEVTCEVCGKPGGLMARGYWYKTLCTEWAKNESNAQGQYEPVGEGDTDEDST